MAGELITEDWEMEYDGLLLGGDSPYSIASIDGLMDLPEVLTSDAHRLKANGLYAGDDHLGGRSVTVVIEVWGDEDTFDAAMSALMGVTRPGDHEKPLVFRIPGVAGGGLREVHCRPRKRNITVGRDFYYKIPIVTVDFYATNPYIFSNEQGEEYIGLAGGGTLGLLFDLEFDASFGGLPTDGHASCVNEGSVDAYPIITITGPCVNPRIENASASKSLGFDLTLADGDELVIDTYERTVILNGTASRYNTIEVGSQWFSFSPGNNTVRFTASTLTTATAAIRWRSAWV